MVLEKDAHKIDSIAKRKTEPKRENYFSCDSPPVIQVHDRQMPIHLPFQDRRQFLGSLGGGLIACQTYASDEKTGRELVYLLNDTHIGEKHSPNSSVPMHLRQVVKELTDLDRKPVATIINGDLALKDGQVGDYRHFADFISPLRQARVSLHLTLGNLDNRESFYRAMKEEQPKAPVVKSRHVSMVATRHANFFLLDSLKKTMVTPGTLGKTQIAWLTKALDAHARKPAVVVTHHNPRLGGDPVHFPGGLVDSDELWEVLSPRRQVKAYIHGHVHDRSYASHRGIHIINAPATSYVADPKQSTTGWTVLKLTSRNVTLTTRTNNPDHPWNNEVKVLNWRS